jgi:hypothetical protein
MKFCFNFGKVFVWMVGVVLTLSEATPQENHANNSFCNVVFENHAKVEGILKDCLREKDILSLYPGGDEKYVLRKFMSDIHDSPNVTDDKVSVIYTYLIEQGTLCYTIS